MNFFLGLTDVPLHAAYTTFTLINGAQK